jgi:hypothetical protein
MAPPGISQHGIFNMESSTSGYMGASISFPLELASGPSWVEVPPGGPNPDPTHCPGTVDAPSAASGYLCLYDKSIYNASPIGTPNNYVAVSNVDLDSNRASPFGARLTAYAASSSQAQVEGAWAVTAP